MTELNSYGVVIISSDLVLKPVGDTSVVNFLARTVEKTAKTDKNETGSVAHFFNFEIWDTAAKYLVEHAKKGDRLILHSATPREHKWVGKEDGKNYSRIVFRVNKFQIFPYTPAAAKDSE